MALEDIISAMSFLFSGIKANNLLLCPDLYFTYFSPVCCPVGTTMTPNYISNSSSDVALSCNCEGSGNQWQDCLRLQQMFTHNNCLREFMLWETGIVWACWTNEKMWCTVMSKSWETIESYGTFHSPIPGVITITWINQGFENFSLIIWDYSKYIKKNIHHLYYRSICCWGCYTGWQYNISKCNFYKLRQISSLS